MVLALKSNDIECKKCSQCGDIKPLTEYYFHTLRGKLKPYSECKVCTIRRNTKYKKEHPQSKEKIKQVHDAYYSKNKEAILTKCKLNYPNKKEMVRIRSKEYYRNHREAILEKGRQYRLNHRKETTIIRRIYDPQNGSRNLQIKTEVITHYSDGKCACVKCGYDDIRALTIDHISGNGNEHRKSNDDIRGSHIYWWLIKSNFPAGYQTLCMNCQLIKRYRNKEYYSQGSISNGG